ncbi:MAG: L-aspartate oxidase [Bacteroidota bacterium]|nr:L-aspartate oxidase [Bacteroidota bacterium]
MSKRRRIICAGNGLATLNFAIHLRTDVELLIIAADDFSISNSFMAKGGIAIPVSETDIEQHIRDTIVTGDGLCNVEAVKDIIGAGRQLIPDLEQVGFVFDDSMGREGGHSTSRIRHVGDETGRYLTQHLQKKVMKMPNVHILSPLQLLDLKFENNVCTGVLVGDKRNDVLQWISGDAVVLATGGCGNLYRNNTNGILTNGEGFAIANRAGAKLSGMEFMQFHPTMLYQKHSGTNALITEAFRGAGAVLRNHEMKDLMHDIHPSGSLAPRDIVSRSMYNEMKATGVESLWLDFSSISKERVEKEFPSLYQICKQNGYLASSRIPVTPAAHYMCGGVITNTLGETSMEGLYAIGEIANTGLHGANRLASNSLLELMVVSERAAKQINNMPEKNEKTIIPFKGDSRDLNSVIDKMTEHLKSLMWANFGIIRNEAEMNRGITELNTMQDELNVLHKKESINIALNQMINRVQTALLIAQSAIHRKESKGCHYRDDMPLK